MNRTSSSPFIHLLPSLRDVAFFMPVLFVLLKLNGAPGLLEGDTGWHIRAGEWMLQNHRIADTDFFSYSKPGGPWLAFEWLTQVLFGWLHGWGGMGAVVGVGLLLLCVINVLLYEEILRKCNNCLLAIGLTFLASTTASVHWLARPHLFTLLFGLISFRVLDNAAAGNTRLLWILPPLVVLWTNLHGGFFIVVLLTVAFAGGAVAKAVFAATPDARKASLRESIPFFVVAAGCTAASLINPYHYHLHEHIFRVLTNNWHFRTILEFLSISFQHPAARYFESMLFLGTAAAVWHLRHGRFAYTFLILGWAHLGLIAARNIAIYALISAPLIALAMREWIEALIQSEIAAWVRRVWAEFEDVALDVAKVESISRLPLSRIAITAVLMMLLLSPSPPERLRSEYNEKYPNKALDVIQSRASNRIFTTDEWGDYLIYKFYPKVKVFIDGRSDYYGETFAQRYLDVMNIKPGWTDTLDKHCVDTILLPVDEPLAGALKQLPGWQVIHDDGVAIMFIARSGLSGCTSSVAGSKGPQKEHSKPAGTGYLAGETMARR